MKPAPGPRWHYNLDELHAAYGEWISDYSARRPERYHAGPRVGQSTQAGLLQTLRFLVECGGFDEADFFALRARRYS